jgi:ABC-2 type transport system permease protein
MKQAVFNPITKRFSILIANLKFTYQIETAFRINNWANVLSTCFYTLSMILFLDVIYSNVKDVAGYSRDEMFLFMFVGQTAYYVSWIIHGNFRELISDVKSGGLDMLLIRPVPSLFYVTFKKIRIFSFLRDSVPPMIVLSLAINWENLHFTSGSLFAGFIIGILGIIATHIFHFLATIPVFWFGESESILSLSEDLEYNTGKIIPFEGFDKKTQFLFMTLIPFLISTAISTGVMLHKLPILPSVIAAMLVTVGGIFVRQYSWNLALKAYSSASS